MKYTSEFSGGSMGRAIFAVLCFAGVTAMADVTNVSVQGKTATQAILQYTAPDAGACTIEVSESSSFLPLVHDLDPVLFPGSNLDSRSENISNERERFFVIGKRRAEKAANGHWYSRALQAYTAHYYRITCGTDQATGSFFTSNIPLGNTYNEGLPPDPSAGTTPYYVSGGQYAWPEFVNWDNTTGRDETVIDPFTGMLLKRMTMPRDKVTGNYPAGDHDFGVVVNPDGVWTNPGAVLADDSSSATFSGSGRNWLVMRTSPVSFAGFPLEGLILSVKGWCSGTCAGDDAKIQACLTVNGLSCWPNQNNTVDITLGTTPNPTKFVTGGDSLPIMTAWTPVGIAPLTPTDAQSRVGTVNVDVTGGMTWVGGDYFYPNWIAGSKITIGTSECSTVNVANARAMTIDPASCSPALSLPLSGAAFSASNFGVLIRKKTASAETISIQYARYSLTETLQPRGAASGSPQYCSDTLTRNSVTGALGYHCVLQSGQIYWIDRVTGTANYLGLQFAGGQSGPDGWQTQGCNAASVTFVGKGPLDPEQFYCTGGDTANNTIILGCTLSSTNQPNDLDVTCTNLTRASLGQDLLSLIAQFTAGYSPTFDPVKFGGCGTIGLQSNRLVIGCLRGYQDTIGWVVVFDPAMVGTAPGCVGNGKPGCVVAASSSWATYPARWCTIHTAFMAGNSDVSWVLGKYLGDWPGMPGGGFHVSTVVSGSLSSHPSIPAGTGGCPPGTNGCDLVTVDGEPCNPDPAPAVGGHPGEGGNCPKNPAWDYLQDAKPGDVFLTFTDPWEFLRVVSKNGNQWLLERGYGFHPPIDLPAGVQMSADCSSRRFDYGVSSTGWTWDFIADPHGLNANGTSIRITPDYSHPVARPNLVIGEPNWVDLIGYGYAITDGPGYGPPNKYVEMAPPFAGTQGITRFLESAQNHPSYPQDTAPPEEQRWFLDARPLSGPGSQIVDQATKVSGQLYKFTSTTTDGDTLKYIGGPDAVLGGLNRKRQGAVATCGAQPLVDVSSAARGNMIADDASSAYQYCVARAAGECRAGSTMGDIYVNCPYAMPRQDGTYGCDSARGDPALSNDMCVTDTGAYLNAVVQLGYEHSDPTGALGRTLTRGLIRYRVLDPNENVHGLPDGSWLIVEATTLQAMTTEFLMAKVPPFPPVDTINRGTFIPMVLNLTPPNGLGVDNVVVQFGYTENGAPEQFYCTTRRDACLAATATFAETNPFRFASEGSDGTMTTVAGVSCASGCSVAIPALAQRVLYYQVLYRDSNNAILAQTRMQMITTP